ncbi:MAG TPA: hypothetical protein VEU62_23960 [Bryobacterales bacterium]|nr:hypothetical protein [Bryobacterales bacterium]
MKDQYFGDVNDFRKYGLLRTLVIPDRLRLGVCWMLTEPDGKADGKFLAYLGKPKTYRHSDPELFDWLKQVIIVEQDRRIARIEGSALLGSASFQSGILTDREGERSKYFSECSTRFAGCDLVFFDPDTGLEIRSVSRGCKNSRRYLHWDEVCNTFTAGSSVLIYQHFIREKRAGYIARMTDELRDRTGAATVFSFRTPHVLFLLASQERHTAALRRRLAAIRAVWAPAQILAAQHPHPMDRPPAPIRAAARAPNGITSEGESHGQPCR